ncbi:unnamed protein product [Calypogeia fissa]
MADSSYPRSNRSYEQDNDPFRSKYRSGHTPSAPPSYFDDKEEQQQLERFQQRPPPRDEFDEFPHPNRHGEDFALEHREPPGPREQFFGRPEKDETVGGYLFSRMVRPLWRGSHTVLRIDLSRSLAYDSPVVNRRRRHRSAPSGAVASSGGPDYFDDEESQGSRSWFNGISGGGARLKIMQVWDAPPDLLGSSRQHWNLNMGFGLNVEVEKGLLLPRFRLKARHIALHLLPQPEIELRGKWPLWNTRLAINAKYRIPLTMDLEEMWSSPGARLMVNFFNPLGSGFHLTPGGVEFDEHLVQLGEHTKLRFAAALQFPRKLPMEEDEQPVRLRVDRLGVKTIIKSGVV